MDLKKYKLGDIADIINGATPSTSCEDNYDGEIVWITPKDLSEQKAKYVERGSRNITQEGFNSCSAQMIPAYNILMSSRAPIGLLAINTAECCTNQGFKNIVVDRSICDVDFLYYYLKYHIKEIEALGSGTTFKEVSKASLQQFEITIPSLDVQKHIASILADIDQKIALNRAINDNLEAMAKQLYDYWFVQFDFPNMEGKPYKSSGGKMVWNDKLKREIPGNWLHKDIKSFMRIFTGKKDVSKAMPGPYKFFSCAPEPITSDEYIYDGAAVLVSGNGSYTGRVNFYKGKMDLYQRTYACVVKEDESTIPFFYYTLRYLFQPIFSGGKHGSSIPYIVLGDLADFMFAYNVDVVKLFVENISAIFNNRIVLQQEIENLTKQRDELLPLLMNGQVSVNYHLYVSLYIDSLILNYTLNARLYERNIFRRCNPPIRIQFYSRANCDGSRDSKR